MNTCRACKSNKLQEINASIFLGQSVRDIARRYGISKDSVARHSANCLAEAMIIAKTTGKVQVAITTRDHVAELFQYATKMRNALDAWLTDPDNADKYTLDARADEVSIIYKEQVGKTEKGTPVYERRRELLSVLLERVTSGLSYEIKAVETKRSDPRKLIIEVLDQLHKDCDILAKLSGDYQQDRANQHDAALLKETTIQAVKLIYQKSRDEAKAQIAEEEQAIAIVWPEAERLARQELASEKVQ